MKSRAPIGANLSAPIEGLRIELPGPDEDEDLSDEERDFLRWAVEVAIRRWVRLRGNTEYDDV